MCCTWNWLAQKTTTNRIISSQGLIIIRSKRNTFIIHNQAPLVRKSISANPRLNCPNPRNKFVLRLNSVPRSLISTIQGLNKGLNLTHLARWINSLIRWKSSQTNQNGGLTLCWFCFNPEPGEDRNAIQATWWFFRIWFYRFSHRRAIPRSVFPRFFEFSHRGQTAVRRSVLEMFHTTRAKQEI